MLLACDGSFFDYLLSEMPEFNVDNIEHYFSCFGLMKLSEIEQKPVHIDEKITPTSNNKADNIYILKPKSSKDMT